MKLFISMLLALFALCIGCTSSESGDKPELNKLYYVTKVYDSEGNLVPNINKRNFNVEYGADSDVVSNSLNVRVMNREATDVSNDKAKADTMLQISFRGYRIKPNNPLSQVEEQLLVERFIINDRKNDWELVAIALYPDEGGSSNTEIPEARFIVMGCAGNIECPRSVTISFDNDGVQSWNYNNALGARRLLFAYV